MYPSTNVFGSYLVELVTHFGWSNVGLVNELQLINEVSQILKFVYHPKSDLLNNYTRDIMGKI